MKKILFLFPLVLFLFSCETEQDECACYDAALDGKEPSEECTEYVKGMSKEDLEEKSNECFGSTVEDLSGASGL